MRLLAFLFIGLISFFLLGHVLARISKAINFKLPITYSIPGLLLFIFGLVWAMTHIGTTTPQLIGFFSIGAGFGLMLHHLLYQSFIFNEAYEHAWVRRHEQGVERFLEMLPGILTWTALTSPIWLSFILPFAVAYLILIADIYWLISALKIGTQIYIGYRRMETAKKIDWLKRLEEDFSSEWKSYYHLLVLPTANEGLEIVGPAFEAVAKSDYPKDRIFLAVGLEEKVQQKDPQLIEDKIKEAHKYDGKIGAVFTTIHPVGLPGELIGPGTNRNWMIRNAVKELAKRGIKPEQVIVTTLDADYVIHERFLSGMLHKYLSIPVQDRMKRSLTGIFLFYNNYWQTPAPMRLVAVGTSYWQMAEMVGSDKYMNYSSLSINMKSLLDLGLWIPNKVNDDSGFYWTAYYHFKGEYKVIPHYLPLYGDAVLDINLVKTFQNQYLQLKRWAYGVEHIPFIIKQYFIHKDINFWNKTDMVLFKLWSELKWTSLALFVTFAGLIVPFVNPNYSQSVVSYNLPIISSYILTFGLVGMFGTIYVHEKTVPTRPKSWSKFQKFWTYVQWLLIPLIMVTISTVPAIDAQTSLMMGRYLEYRVTNKARVKV
jgi:hypothetical protein